MAANGLRVRIRIDGVRETLAATRALGKDAEKELRERSKRLAETLAAEVRAAAVADSRQSALIAPTVKAAKDRVPTITAGGAKKVGRNRVPAHKVLFGAEFGATTLKQFRPHVGTGSYFFFRTVEREQDRIGREWNELADDVIRRWGGAR